MKCNLLRVIVSLGVGCGVLFAPLLASAFDWPWSKRTIPKVDVTKVVRETPQIHNPVISERHEVGGEFTATGRVFRVLTWNDNTTTPCMAVVVRDDGKAFDAFARAFDNDGLKKYAASALCDMLIDAFESQKSVMVSGEIEELGMSNELGNLKIESVNYIDGYTFGENEDIPFAGALRCNEMMGSSECSGHGRVVRVLNWIDNSTTLCMAILKTNEDKTIQAFVRMPQNYGSFNDDHQAMVAHSMLKACRDLSAGLGSQKPTYVQGAIEDGGSLRTTAVNVLQEEGNWGDELPKAF